MLQRRLWRHSSSSLPSEDDEEVDGDDNDDDKEEEEHEDEDKDDNHAAEAPLTSLFSSSAISRWIVDCGCGCWSIELMMNIMRK